MNEKQLLYRMARLIANPDQLGPNQWGEIGGTLLQQLHALDAAAYDKFVEAPMPKGHEANDTPVQFATFEELLDEMGRRCSGLAIGFTLKDAASHEIDCRWGGGLSMAYGHSRRLYLHLDALIKKQIREANNEPDDDTDPD